MLFATLDPTMRQDLPPGIDKAILSDTVGFVSDLPHQLIAAFRATLEEVLSADLILHVRDIAHPDTDAQRPTCSTCWVNLGALPADVEGNEAGPAVIEVWNKLDLVVDSERTVTQSRSGRRGEGQYRPGLGIDGRGRSRSPARHGRSARAGAQAL